MPLPAERPPTQEEITRLHRRLQQDLAVCSHPPGAAASSVEMPPDAMGVEQLWLLVILLAVVGTAAAYLLSQPPSVATPARALALAAPAAASSQARVVFNSPAPFHAPVAQDAFSAPAPPPARRADNAGTVAFQPAQPVPPATRAFVPPPAPTPDPAVKERRILELKNEAAALDDFIRAIRNNPYASHSAEPGHYSYFHWQFSRGNVLKQPDFDAYMKRLDARRDVLRREKWQLEGR